MKKIRTYLRSNLYLDVWFLFFLFLSFFIEPLISLSAGTGFIMNPAEQVFKGYLAIIQSSSILVTDYVYIAGLGATFFNVATILIINLLLIKGLKIQITGPVFAGVMMICGFSFFGKNIFNTIPIYFGIYLFSLFKKIPYKNFIITILFSTGISPLVSYCFFGFRLAYYISIPLGIVCGIVAGFLLPAFSSHTVVFHEGFNLYNVGFALGIISAVFYGIFTLADMNVQTVLLYDYSTTKTFYIILPVMSVISMVIGICLNPKKIFPSYLAMTKTSGRLVSDYVRQFGIEAVLFNFGTIGLSLFVICVSFQVPMNGVIFGSIVSILGFSGFGLHLKNVLPIWIGAGLMIYIWMLVRNYYVLQMSSIMAFIFASGLAPICGKYGIVYGLAAGMLHIVLTPIMLYFQGGFDLYNNGLSAGFEAAILNVVGEKIFVRRERNGRRIKNL